MIPWIQVYSNLLTHPKTTKLADELKLSSAAVNPNVVAVGILVSLWTWAAQNAVSGDLSETSDRAIADACRWKKSPEALRKALEGAGFIDADGKLHDWDEYAVLMMASEDNRKAKTRERVKRYREAKKEETSVTCNAECNVTETLCNAPTIPDHTRPDNNISFFLSDRGAEAQAENAENVEKSVENSTSPPNFGALQKYWRGDHMDWDAYKRDRGREYV